MQKKRESDKGEHSFRRFVLSICGGTGIVLGMDAHGEKTVMVLTFSSGAHTVVILCGFTAHPQLLDAKSAPWSL